MKSSTLAIILVFFTTALTSAGQVLYKYGTNSLPTSPVLIDYLFNPLLLSGLAVYFIGAVILIIALKWGELSVLYPIIATSYIWVSLMSIYFFGETMNTLKWLGVFVIIIGVALINYGGSEQHAKTGEA